MDFEDLAAVAGPRCRASDLAGWIAAVLTGGIVVDAGYERGPDGHPAGPRRYVLTEDGRRRLAADRRR